MNETRPFCWQKSLFSPSKELFDIGPYLTSPSQCKIYSPLIYISFRLSYPFILLFSIWVQLLNRRQNRLALLRIPLTAFKTISSTENSQSNSAFKISIILEELSDAWINVCSFFVSFVVILFVVILYVVILYVVILYVVILFVVILYVVILFVVILYVVILFVVILYIVILYVVILYVALNLILH